MYIYIIFGVTSIWKHVLCISMLLFREETSGFMKLAGAGLACAPKNVVSLVHLKSAMF